MADQERGVGMIGLGVMGRNLLLNIEDQGFPVAVWNLQTEWTDAFLAGEGSGRNITGVKSLEELSSVLTPPRRILMMIKAGQPVDATLDQLLPYLEAGDVVLDGGNSHFEDTISRQQVCGRKGIYFFGLGVSGGEEGARHGPSLMPGGDRVVYEQHLQEVLKRIAAISDSGPCVGYIGPGGSGHFVKMVHNGIEYGDMELIAEAYDVMGRGLGMNAEEISEVFASWNRGRLSSYLINITSRILQVRDPATGNPLVEMILDKAGQKGTGKWTAQSALDLGVPVPTISAALDARFLSAIKEQRIEAAVRMPAPSGFLGIEKEMALKKLEVALYASKICTYAQGMSVITAGSQEHKWGINEAEVCRIWKSGCIIRARLLDDIRQVFQTSPGIRNLLLNAHLSDLMLSLEKDWRDLVTSARRSGIPTLSMAASLSYFDAFRSVTLPLNLTQAQRDFFGAHTYRRVDDPHGKTVHTDWQNSEG